MGLDQECLYRQTGPQIQDGCVLPCTPNRSIPGFHGQTSPDPERPIPEADDVSRSTHKERILDGIKIVV